MTAKETFDQLSLDIEKSVNAITNVRTIHQFQEEKRIPDYSRNHNKGMHEYWIALGIFTFTVNLSYLNFVVNAHEQILPAKLDTKVDINNYLLAFKQEEQKVIAAFEQVIGKPNIQFVGYSQPITMEQYLQEIVNDIHDEAENLEYNYRQFVSLPA